MPLSTPVNTIGASAGDRRVAVIGAGRKLILNGVFVVGRRLCRPPAGEMTKLPRPTFDWPRAQVDRVLRDRHEADHVRARHAVGWIDLARRAVVKRAAWRLSRSRRRVPGR